MSDSNISLEEQIFFEKQTNSLNSTKIHELRQEVSDITIEIDKSSIEINNLNDELK
jgi:hypothetical protein